MCYLLCPIRRVMMNLIMTITGQGNMACFVLNNGHFHLKMPLLNLNLNKYLYF